MVFYTDGTPTLTDHASLDLKLWGLSVKGIREVAASEPGQGFAIEYKFKEPRSRPSARRRGAASP